MVEKTFDEKMTEYKAIKLELKKQQSLLTKFRNMQNQKIDAADLIINPHTGEKSALMQIGGLNKKHSALKNELRKTIRESEGDLRDFRERDFIVISNL